MAEPQLKPRLLLCGPIGCGKSTMIANALGPQVLQAGGYVTLRVIRNGELEGFDLAPAAALLDPLARTRSGRFLDFRQGLRRDQTVFLSLGTRLLQEAPRHPFALLDEFGGMELLVPDFRQALTGLLVSDLPCIGVIKTPEASRELAQRTGLGRDYEQAYGDLFAQLSQDPGTGILYTTGRYDDRARETVQRWVSYYVRK